VYYEAYRRDDPTPSLSASTARQLRVDGWTQAGSVAAHGDDTYGIDVTTDADSTLALGLYNSVFFIRASTATPGVYYDSPPDSGYSVDNLAPGAPSNFIYNAGELSWNQSSAADFDYFSIYGGNVDAFGSAVLVDYSVAPTLDVSASPYAYYYVTATDFSGNEGKPAKVHAPSGVGGTPSSFVLSVSNYPNPFNPSTVVKYTVPARGIVSVRIYHASGARVMTLFNGQREAGAYAVQWDGRDERGQSVSSGVYFARIEHSGRVRTKKMTLLK
jgi:hypothetical protein